MRKEVISQKLYSWVLKLLGGYHGTKTNNAGKVQTTDESIQEKKDEN